MRIIQQTVNKYMRMYTAYDDTNIGVGINIQNVANCPSSSTL